MAKKIIALALALIMLFALAACGNGSTPAPPAEPPAPVENSAAPAANPADPAEGDSEFPYNNYDINAVEDIDDWEVLDLSYATYLTADNPIGKLYTDSWQKVLDEIMPGYVNITIYPSGTLLAQADILEGVEQGIADIGMVDVSSVKDLLPVTAMWAMPGCHATATTSGCPAINEWINMVGDELDELSSVVVLCAQGNQAGQMVTAFEWNDVSELKGKQIRATAAFSDIVTSLGAIPVSVATSELYEASRSGLIDGAYYTITANFLQGSNEFLKYGTFTNMCTSPYLYVMNKDLFERLPESEQAFLKEAFQRAFWEEVVPLLPEIGDIHDGCQTAISEGNYHVYNLPEETVQEMWDLCAPITENYIAEHSASIPNMQEYYDQMSACCEKWNEWYPMEKYTEPFFLSRDKGFDYVKEHIADFAPSPLPDDIYGYTPVANR